MPHLAALPREGACCARQLCTARVVRAPWESTAEEVRDGEAIACRVALTGREESAPGHLSRCSTSPFVSASHSRGLV